MDEESTSEDETTESNQEILDTSSMAKILIIGETGSGKSTFVNYLTNYFYKGTLQKLHIAIPSRFHPNPTEKFVHCENDIQNTTHSKTDSCNQYMFRSNSKQYLFVDTPGLSDTRGAQQDDKNVAKILESVESLGGLTAVIMVVNGAVSRLTINLRNVITRLRGNLPDAVMDNVIVVLTNVTRYAYNFSIEALELSGNVYPYFMQNSAFSQDPAAWTPVVLEAIQYEFDRSMNELRNMIKTIDTFKTKSVNAFQKMKDIRSDIRILFHEAHIEVAQIQKLQEEISSFENLVKECDTNLITYKDYAEEQEIDTTEVVDCSVSNTLCGQCNRVCHENCKLNETTTSSTQFSSQCWVFKNGFCQKCVSKCPPAAHYYAKKTIKASKKKIQVILNDIKWKYDKTTDEKIGFQKDITSKEDARKILELALKEKTEEIKQLCLKLRDICAGFDYTQELNVFISQLETEESMLRSIETRQQTRALIRGLKDLCVRMESDPDLAVKKPTKMNIINTELPVGHQTGSTSRKSTKVEPSQQNSDTSASDPPAESDTYANDDILAVIRAINKKKAAKTEQSETDTESDSSDDESSTESESSENESDESEEDAPAVTNTRDLTTLSIDELITSYNSQDDHPEADLIKSELVQRSLGKSTGPMKTPESVADFEESTRKYSALGADELAKEYETLQHRINDIVGSDILKINQVPSNTLNEVAAVYKLLHPSSSMQDSHPTPTPSPLNSSDSSTKLDNQLGADSKNAPKYIQLPFPKSSSNSNKTLERQQQPDTSINSSEKSSPTSNISDSERSSPCPLQPPSWNVVPVNAKLSYIDQTPSAKLISDYNDAYAQNKTELCNSYYNVLKRRCYGNYPLLISEKRELFDKMFQKYQDRTLEDLKEFQLRTHDKIDGHVFDGNHTRVDDIPTELIIEAAALNHLISTKKI